MASTDFSLFAYEEVEQQKKEKAPNALRTISEASEILDVPQHVLRFWETKFTQIKPLKRNGGRRFYRPQDLDILQQIKHLLYNQGYTIKGAKKAVDDFIHARATQEVNSAEWIAAIPPANMNDNFVTAVAQEAPVAEAVAAAPDILSEIAEALSEPEAQLQLETPAPSAIVISPDFEALRALRAELAATRDELHMYIADASAAVH
jgi:DNA-binding transcriptional MerR regulator